MGSVCLKGSGVDPIVMQPSAVFAEMRVTSVVMDQLRAMGMPSPLPACVRPHTIIRPLTACSRLSIRNVMAVENVWVPIAMLPSSGIVFLSDIALVLDLMKTLEMSLW